MEPNDDELRQSTMAVEENPVVRVLAEAPAPVMPLSVWTRLEAALAVEAANREAQLGRELPQYTVDKDLDALNKAVENAD